MPKLTRRSPRYCRHKRTGRAVMYLDGKEIPLGVYKSPDSLEKYDRLVAEWLQRGRRRPATTTRPVTLLEAVDRFWEHASNHYQPRPGNRSGEAANYKSVLRDVLALYGSVPVNDFGPLQFKAVRERLIEAEYARTHINGQMRRVCRMFRWLVEEELASPETLARLRAVTPLRRGKTNARETKKVRPADARLVQLAIAHASPQIGAMLKLQALTGMRCGEVCGMRACEIDQEPHDRYGVWLYRPSSHKTAHHEHERIIPLNAQAIEVLRPFLNRSPAEFLFSPTESRQWQRKQATLSRLTPSNQGNTVGSHVKLHPERTPGTCYDANSYGRAIAYLCEKAFPWPGDAAKPKRVTKAAWLASLSDDEREERRRWRESHQFHSHQIRHLVTTDIRAKSGAEAAQLMLGDRCTNMVDLYAEKSLHELMKLAANYRSPVLSAPNVSLRSA